MMCLILCRPTSARGCALCTGGAATRPPTRAVRAPPASSFLTARILEQFHVEAADPPVGTPHENDQMLLADLAAASRAVAATSARSGKIALLADALHRADPAE